MGTHPGSVRGELSAFVSNDGRLDTDLSCKPMSSFTRVSFMKYGQFSYFTLFIDHILLSWVFKLDIIRLLTWLYSCNCLPINITLIPTRRQFEYCSKAINSLTMNCWSEHWVSRLKWVNFHLSTCVAGGGGRAHLRWLMINYQSIPDQSPR